MHRTYMTSGGSAHGEDESLFSKDMFIDSLVECHIVVTFFSESGGMTLTHVGCEQKLISDMTRSHQL